MARTALWKLVIAAFSLSPSSSLQAAGADSSGGGELLRDQLNPWFVQNTTHVTYCLNVDPTYFSQQPANLKSLIDRAFAYWKRQLWLVRRNLSGPVLLGTQAFEWTAECRPDTDIWFQFGRLEPWQREYLQDPTEYVGVAVRVEYDKETLSGSGFVYISPDSGPDRYRGSEYMNWIWRDLANGRLYRLLQHEIGHIFGIPHFGTRYDVMGVGFPEMLVEMPISPGFNPLRLNYHLESLVFDYAVPRVYCGLSMLDGLREGLEYLGINQDCAKFVFQSNGGFDLFQARNRQAEWALIGRASVHGRWGDHYVSGSSHIYLTGLNRVFPLPRPDSIRRQGVSGVLRFGADATYQHLASGTQKPVTVDLRPNHADIGGIQNGRMSSRIFYLLREHAAAE